MSFLAFKYRKIKGRRFSEPRCVGCVIFQAITGLPVNQDIQAGTVGVEPWDQSIELGRIERELTAPVRMGPDEFLMHSAHFHAKERCGRLAEFTRLLR